MRGRGVYWLGVVSLALGVVLMAVGGWRWHRGRIEAERLAAVQAGRAAVVTPDDGPRVRLAWANRLLRRQRYEDALAVFGALLESAPPSVLPWVYYDLGNLYLRRARDQVARSEFDEAMPLVALAKQSYRRALSLESGLWAARYNLEAALRLLPEIERLGADREEDEEAPGEALWTRVPGFPRGLP